MAKVICFYHSADLDGHCSGAIVKRRFPDCELYGINYGQEFPWERIEREDTVIMVDFSLQPFEDMHKLKQSCREFIWLDHHVTALDEALKSNFEYMGSAVNRVGIGACLLSWVYFFPYESIPLPVELLAKYDVFDLKDDRILPFQYGMRLNEDTYPTNTRFWDRVFYGSDTEEIIQIGTSILKYEESQNKKFCGAYSFETNLFQLKAIAINRGFTNSKIFDSVWNPEKYHLMITFIRLPLPKMKWTVSLYTTREDINCGEIAKMFGGGGHRKAAGFQCEKLPFVY